MTAVGNQVVPYRDPGAWRARRKADSAQGVVLRRGYELPPLAWIPSHSGRPLDLELVEPITNMGPTAKPQGGLWASPLSDPAQPHSGTAWTQWCWQADYAVPEDGDIVTLLAPAPRAVFAVVDCLADLVAMCRQWPLGIGHPRFAEAVGPLIDFEAAALSIDGIFLTEAGQRRTRLTKPHLYGWDVATVLFLRPSFAVQDEYVFAVPDEWREAR